MLFTTSADQIPLCRVSDAIKRGVEKNLLFLAGGGIGDQICAEPTIRYALDNFKDCNISILTHTPELFRHLVPRLQCLFERARWSDAQIGLDKYLCLKTYANSDDFSGQFISSIIKHCIDYPADLALRGSVPIKYRQPIVEALTPPHPLLPTGLSFDPIRYVFIHAGKGWPTKTFPADWWNRVLAQIIKRGGVPVLIGTDTVEVDSTGCQDFRGRTTIMETVWLLKKARVLLTNDSAPLHMAAVEGSKAWIGFLATCKRADYLYHYRGPKNEFAWRMKDFSLGGVWDCFDFAPNKNETVDVKNISQETLAKWLPVPELVGNWALNRWRYLP